MTDTTTVLPDQEPVEARNPHHPYRDAHHQLASNAYYQLSALLEVGADLAMQSSRCEAGDAAELAVHGMLRRTYDLADIIYRTGIEVDPNNNLAEDWRYVLGEHYPGERGGQ